MPDALPPTLCAAWAIAFAFWLAQSHHEAAIRNFDVFETWTLMRLLSASTTIGLLGGAALLVYHLLHSYWYWTLALGLGGAIVGGLAMGVASAVLGNRALSLLGLVGLPLCLLGAAWVIHTNAAGGTVAPKERPVGAAHPAQPLPGVYFGGLGSAKLALARPAAVLPTLPTLFL